MIKRKETPDISRCRCGGTATACPCFGSNWAVFCDAGACWRGPVEHRKIDAVIAWNEGNDDDESK